METEYKTPPEKFAAFLKRQRMVFIVAFLGYVCAYLVRNNFKLMSKSIMVANDWNKDDIAMLLSCLTVSYGLAKFYMGALGDKMSLRKLFATCVAASAVISPSRPWPCCWSCAASCRAHWPPPHRT